MRQWPVDLRQGVVVPTVQLAEVVAEPPELHSQPTGERGPVDIELLGADLAVLLDEEGARLREWIERRLERHLELTECKAVHRRVARPIRPGAEYVARDGDLGVELAHVASPIGELPIVGRRCRRRRGCFLRLVFQGGQGARQLVLERGALGVLRCRRSLLPGSVRPHLLRCDQALLQLLEPGPEALVRLLQRPLQGGHTRLEGGDTLGITLLSCEGGWLRGVRRLRTEPDDRRDRGYHQAALAGPTRTMRATHTRC